MTTHLAFPQLRSSHSLICTVLLPVCTHSATSCTFLRLSCPNNRSCHRSRPSHICRVGINPSPATHNKAPQTFATLLSPPSILLCSLSAPCRPLSPPEPLGPTASAFLLAPSRLRRTQPAPHTHTHTPSYTEQMGGRALPQLASIAQAVLRSSSGQNVVAGSLWEAQPQLVLVLRRPGCGASASASVWSCGVRGFGMAPRPPPASKGDSCKQQGLEPRLCHAPGLPALRRPLHPPTPCTTAASRPACPTLLHLPPSTGT